MQLILFLALVVAIVILYAGFKELNKKIKHSIVVALVLVFILGGVYSFVVDRQTLGNRELVNHFNQGKTLICKEYEVDNIKFGYENGTESFVAKSSQKTLVGVIVPLSSCRDVKE